MDMPPPNLRKLRIRRPEPDMKLVNDWNAAHRPKDKSVQARRGLRSLAMAVSLPLSLAIISKYASSSAHSSAVYSAAKPFWFPPLWALHTACLAVTFLMGLSAWLVWAEGGFHRRPATLYLYAAQLGLTLAWDPLVFHLGATHAALGVCLAMFGATCACARAFKEVNMIAGDLVKPCLAWAAILSIVNLDLVAVST